jgi:hypothetical protein
MEILQMLDILKISCDFAVMSKVMRKRERILVIVPSDGDWRVVVIC